MLCMLITYVYFVINFCYDVCHKYKTLSWILKIFCDVFFIQLWELPQMSTTGIGSCYPPKKKKILLQP